MVREISQLKATVMELLVNLVSRIDDIVKLYNTGNNQKGNERVVFLADDISSLAEAVQVLENESFKVSVEELNSKLRLLLEQYENEDYLFVSDLLRYELKPLFEQWQEEIQDVQ